VARGGIDADVRRRASSSRAARPGGSADAQEDKIMVYTVGTESEATRGLAVASARGPVTWEFVDGRLVARQAAGGLASALVGALDDTALWVAAAQNGADTAKAREQAGASFRQEVLGRALNVQLLETPDFGPFAEVLAQIQLMQSSYLTRFDTAAVRDAFARYQAANEIFVQALAGRPRVMLNDHHLYLVPEGVRAINPNVEMWLYVHMSESSPQVWRVLPAWMRNLIFRSILKCDLVAFHSPYWASEFFDICAEMSGVVVDREKRLVSLGGRHTAVRVYSLPADKHGWLRRRQSARVNDLISEMTAPGVVQICSIDRSDRIKNVERAYEAYAMMLEHHPELKTRVVFRSQVVPSRQDLAVKVDGRETFPYKKYMETIRRAAARLNRRFGTTAWRPLHLLDFDDRDVACALMSLYDVLLVVPLIEGMNTVAKEGPLLNERGAVLLSPNVGAASLLTDAIAVDQFDVWALAESLYAAVMMTPAERGRIGHKLHQVVINEDSRHWLLQQLADLHEIIQAR
jgi:trehalose 6-phosphate synthase